MKIHKVLGNVTLSRCHPCYTGARLLATEPMELESIGGPVAQDPELVIVWDDLGAGQGSRVAVSDGAEAAQSFRPELKAVDAYLSAILDVIHIDPEAIKQIRY